ncbi:MAG: hypothetical protein WBE38_12225 [Terracidiphilus sp.]|jgi:hypothetical protein
MLLRLDRTHRVLPVLLGFIALASAGVLFAWDAGPGLFPARTHDAIAAFSLAMIAVAYLVYQIVRRATGMDLAKAVLLAAAFLFWAANQVGRNPRAATLFNDLAIALFILDIFLVMAGWPSTAPDSSFAEACGCDERCGSEPTHSSAGKF